GCGTAKRRVQQRRGKTARSWGLNMRPLWNASKSGPCQSARFTPTELPQPLHQLHHRPRVALAVVEQVLAHAIALVPRNLVRHEQQPGDLYTRHPAVHDHEIVVGQLGHEGREDVLQTEAAPEVGVVHAVLHDRVQIDELRLERRELGGELVPGHTGMARAIVSKSRKPNRAGAMKGWSSCASVRSTMIRFSAIALSWRRWVKLSFSLAGRSAMLVIPRAR